MRKQLESYLSDRTKTNMMLKAFSAMKVPLLFATGARVQRIDDQQCVIRIPFFKFVKNHLGSLYFGALAIGADACVGMLAVHKIYQRDENISLVFKSFSAQFLKRAVGPTDFVCDEGDKIDALIEAAIASGERVHKKISARAVTHGETVAEFTLELSLKKKLQK